VAEKRDSHLGAPPSTVHRRYEEIDVLRGFACIWVALSHYLPYWNDHLGPTTVLIPEGWGVYAVKLFFVISGFVIFATVDRCKSVSEFAVLRFSRLYPTYWATLLLATFAGALLFGKSIWLGGLIVNMTMFQEFLRFPNLDNVYWSLTVELAFYLNLAWLMALGWHRYPRRVVFVWLLAAGLWASTSPVLPTPHRSLTAMLFALDFAPYFAFGILIYGATRRGWTRADLGLGILAFGTEFLMTGWLGLGIALFIVLIVVLAVGGKLPFLVSRPTLLLGWISYSLYLIHRNLGWDALAWLHARGVGPAVAVPLALTGAFAIATAVTYGIERPGIRWIRSVYKQFTSMPREAAG